MPTRFCPSGQLGKFKYIAHICKSHEPTLRPKFIKECNLSATLIINPIADLRIWSIHPKYLDAKGLVALWREGLLAQKVLKGKTQGYRNHPQLNRFKKTRDPIAAIGKYLYHIHKESLKRDYKFDLKKISDYRSRMKINVSSGQVEFEIQHLLKKLKSRDRSLYLKIQILTELDVHPIFRVVHGKIADWKITI